MAISPDFPGLTISIRIGHRKLPEYRDDDIQDPPRTVSYMIEAVPDSIFSIHAHTDPGAVFTGSALALYFYVDGNYVDGTLIDATSGGGHCQSRGRYVRNNMLRQYQFASRERQIELVEKVSSSLSSRPRASKTSSATPRVSYAGYASVEVNSGTPVTPGGASNATSPDYQSATSHATPEVYRSIARPNRDLDPPSSLRPYRGFAPPPPEEYRSTESPLPRKPSIMVNGPALPIRAVGGAVNPGAELKYHNSSLPDNPSNAQDSRLTTGRETSDTVSQPARNAIDLRPHAYKTSRGRGRTFPFNNMAMSDVPEMPVSDAATTPADEVYASRPESVAAPGPGFAQHVARAFSTSKDASSATTKDAPITTPKSTTKDVSNATAGSDFTAPEELGTIKIVVCHVNKKEPVAFGRNAFTTAQIRNEVQDAVKGKSGGLLVRFTAPQAVRPITTWNVGAVHDNDDGDTSVTYLYHYRTREMLDALGVLPTEVKDEGRVMPPPFPSSPEVPKDGDQSMADMGGAGRREWEMRSMSKSYAKDIVPADADSGKDIASDKNAVNKEEENEDWEMVDDEMSGV